MVELLFDIIWRMIAVLLVAQVTVLTVISISVRLREKRKLTPTLPKETHPIVDINGVRLKLYTQGSPLYEDMLQAISEAETSIKFEFYIWKNDVLGERFKEALIAQAEKGVQVYIIYDVFANLIVPRRFKQFPKLETLHVLPFWPLSSLLHILSPRRYALDHRKILVLDNRIGFVGGYNIGETYRQIWRDTHLRLEGEAAQDLGYAFADFWDNNRNRKKHPPLEPPPRQWSSHIRVHRNDPPQHNYPIRSMYLEAIEHAKSHIYITNAYFVPDSIIRRGLLRAAARGVDVRVLLPWQSNHALVDWLARHDFAKYLRHNIRIFGYTGAMIHAKTATIDGVWSMIGTANLDRLSMAGNYEINVEVFDEALASQMEAIFETDLKQAQEITLEAWEQRPWLARLGELVLAPLWPLV